VASRSNKNLPRGCCRRAANRSQAGHGEAAGGIENARRGRKIPSAEVDGVGRGRRPRISRRRGWRKMEAPRQPPGHRDGEVISIESQGTSSRVPADLSLRLRADGNASDSGRRKKQCLDRCQVRFRAEGQRARPASHNRRSGSGWNPLVELRGMWGAGERGDRVRPGTILTEGRRAGSEPETLRRRKF